MGILIAAVGLFVGYGAALLGSREVRYLTRAGFEEIRILKGRRPLAEVIRDPAVDAATRGLLALVSEVRDFAEAIGLDAGDTYTTYTDVGRDTLLLVLSAAPKDCICAKTWSYPIVGRIPYKGFFDARMAEREAGRLDAEGLDTYLRPAGAFSTLGWFNDPLLSTALTRDSMELASTVFHELAHNTLFIKSAVDFNESFAQYVGYRAAERFFLARGDSLTARRAVDRWRDERVLAGLYHQLVERLHAFYATRPAGAALDSGRVAHARWFREQLEGPVGDSLRTYRIGAMADRPINNARLVGLRLYRTRLDLFEQWHARYQEDLPAALRALTALLEEAAGDQAFARLEAALQASG